MSVGWLVRSVVCSLMFSFVSSHPATGYNGRWSAGGSLVGGRHSRQAVLRASGGGSALRALFVVVNVAVL